MDGTPTPPNATAADRPVPDRPVAGTRQAFLPSEVDPTVFDEAFLRQLERLLLLMRSPVRGGLKGGRRSVKRGQSVEFADYRDYSLGDDLRQLDWNVYARLERLFVKLFVEEEDVTITLLIDASASMAWGNPAKLLFAKRAAAALGYIGLASEDRVAVSALTGRIARRRAAMRGTGRVFRLLADLSSIEAADGPTDIVAAARHAGAQLHGRGVVVLISDLLDPAADKVIRELAATGSELVILHVLSPDEIDPALEGDLRLVDVETGDGIDVTVDLATIDAYKTRLAAWKAGFADLAAKRRASYMDLSSDANLADLMFAELRRRRVLGSRVPFTTPLALLGLLFIPAVVAMYLLKLRRDETIVPSTLLWTRLVADVEANAPWQKLRRSLLLLLQLLLVVILALLAARPFLERPAGLARDVVLVIDTSASMAATDVAPNRLEAAKTAAIAALRDLPTGGKVSVIAADRSARIVVNETTDLGRVRQALDGIQTTSAHGDLGDALELAGKLAARSGDAQILVATDGALATPATTTVPARITVLPVGRERKNQAIVAMAVRTAPSAVTRSVFVSVANLDLERAARRLEVWGDGALVEVRDLLLEPQARSNVVIDDVPRDVGTVEVRLVGPDPSVTAAPDQLAVDDRAWAIVPPDRTRLILVVGPGDPYLETALSYLPNVELFGVSAAEYGPASERTDGRPWDLVIFEGSLPSTLPRAPILAIAPGATSPLGEVTGTLTNPGIGSPDPDEPILRYVDLSTTHIASASRFVLPDWARTVIPGPQGAPLLYAGPRNGLPTAVLAFEPRRSDLPLQVAFPILLANLTGELLGGSAAPTEAVQPGTPVSLSLPAGATGLAVTKPDGSVVELVPGTALSAGVTFSGTDLPGVYLVTPHPAATSSAAPSGSGSGATALPTPTAAASPGASAAGGSAAPSTPPVDPNAPVRFAVDLFDVDESTIAPGSVAAIEALGVGPDASASPGPGTGQGSPATTRPTARDELWVPIVLLVLVALCVEWAVYHRDTLIRLRRSLVARLGRNAQDGSA